MRTLSIITTILTFSVFGCGQNQTFMEHAASDFYSNNEDHFGFLIFDKAKIDTFFKEYSPITLQNDKIKNAFMELQNTYINTIGADTIDWSKHTDKPEPTDYELAKSALKATNGKDGENYFEGSFSYLFFFDCLPNEFQNKWVQTRSGNFEFNVTFFNRLRTKCTVFDEIIYGQTGHWDNNIKSVFKHDIFNEIKKGNAQQIKDCILQDTSFSDNRLKADKDNFIMFLDMVIQDKWRLFLLDKN
jgi:hypothetical protein